MCDILQHDMQIRVELLAVQALNNTIISDDSTAFSCESIGGGGLVGGEGEGAQEGGEVRGEVGVRGGYGFVEVYFGAGAGFYDEGAGGVGEDAVAAGV